MEVWGPIIVGLMSSLAVVVVALVQHSKTKAVIEVQMHNLTDKVKCVEDKVDANIRETGKIKDRVIVLEQNVLKGN